MTMESTSELMKYQNELLQKRKNIDGPKKYKKRKNTKQLTPIKSKGYSMLRHFTTDSIISDKALGKRDIKIMFLIYRLTIGLKITSVDLRQVDFEVAGIQANHVPKILKHLLEIEWIKIARTSKVTYYSIHRSRLLKEAPVNNPKLGRLVHRKYVKYYIV